jgi:hypothetical protein
MKKFLEDFLDWLKIMFFVIVLTPIWYFILTYGFNVDLANLSKNDLKLLVVLPPLIISIFLVYLFDKKEVEQEEKEPVEIEPKKKKKKKKKESEIICVTEIQGKRKIIKDGVVIFEEEIKGADLKGVRQITDDNE